MNIRGLDSLPQKHRIWIRLPNWLGDVIMAIPLIKALRASRPDAEITFLTQARFHSLLETLDLADRIIKLPPKGLGYFPFFSRLKGEFPDTYILLTNSFRGDIEAWLTRCPFRAGMLRPGKNRPLLSHHWNLPENLDESKIHQMNVWEYFLQHFGLHAEPDSSPLNLGADNVTSIGLICGTENSPEKRWPVEHWRALIEKILYQDPDVTIQLFGTAADSAITRSVQHGFDQQRVIDQAGKTNLLDFAQYLNRCRLVICNDTGGMHLANAIGVPVVALFGPTNPLRTGPVYDAPVSILQPDGCPDFGGQSMHELKPEKVMKAVEKELAAPLGHSR